MSNPFADIGVADYARDLVALVLLLATFGMPWDRFDTAADKIHVVLATLLAMASLTLPYLKRGSVLPESWDNSHVRLARALATVPYFVVVVITIVVDLSSTAPGRGVGVGVAVGLAGALLAAQAREGELDDPAGQAQAWRMIAVGLGGIAALLTFVRLIHLLADIPAGAEWTVVVLALLEPVIFLVVLAVPVIGVWRGAIDARNLLIAVGVVGLVLLFWRLSDAGTLPDILTLHLWGPAELLWPATAVAVVAPGVTTVFQQVGTIGQWLDTARGAFKMIVVLASMLAAYWVVVMVGVETGRATTITQLVLALLAVVAALVGRNSLRADPKAGRPVALVAAGVVAVLGIVTQSVHSAGERSGGDLVSALAVVGLLTFAATVAFALTTPRVIRDELASGSDAAQ